MEKAHLRRNAKHADEYISGLIVARLSEPDARNLLRPPPGSGVDTGKLSAEQRKLRERKASQMKRHSQGLIDDEDLAVGMCEIKERLTAIDAQLATSDQLGPLAEFRDKPAEVVWNSLPLARKRAVVRLLVRAWFMPVT